MNCDPEVNYKFGPQRKMVPFTHLLVKGWSLMHDVVKGHQVALIHMDPACLFITTVLDV